MEFLIKHIVYMNFKDTLNYNLDAFIILEILLNNQDYTY